MSARDGLCDNCQGTGKVKVTLFFSVVDDPCPVCKGDGKHIYMCPTCKKNKAIITNDLRGNSYINNCKSCADTAARLRQNMVTTATNHTYGYVNPFSYHFGIK